MTECEDPIQRTFLSMYNAGPRGEEASVNAFLRIFLSLSLLLAACLCRDNERKREDVLSRSWGLHVARGGSNQARRSTVGSLLVNLRYHEEGEIEIPTRAIRFEFRKDMSGFRGLLLRELLGTQVARTLWIGLYTIYFLCM